MSEQKLHAREQHRPWCLYGLADSAADVRLSERRLSRERGHEPTLYEVVEDLMARHHIAAPFTGEYPTQSAPPASNDTPPR
jgi:hypothetical protein